MTLPNGHTKDKKPKLRRWPRREKTPEQTLVMSEIIDQCVIPDSSDDRELKQFVPFDRKHFHENERRHHDALAEERMFPRRV